MANMFVQIKVKDFEEWKKAFDSGNDMRVSNGELSHQIYRDANDPSKVFVFYKWNSMANAQKFSQSPELRTAMEKAGVEGMPNASFLNEA